MSSTFIQSEQELRRIIKRPPSTVTAKIESGPLRSTPIEFLATTRLAFVTVPNRGAGPDAGPRLLVFGGSPGFISADNATGDLLIPVDQDQQASLARVGAERFPVGLLLVIPGVRHTLRVNGSAAVRDGAMLVVTPEQSYAHCAKAFIRSAVWDPPAAPAHAPDGPDDANPADGIDSDGQAVEFIDEQSAEFIASSPFGLIGTSLETGEADVSPRGDPPGFVRVLDDHTLFLPDRPGNRIADSLRNIIANPDASLLLMVPGAHRTLEISGEAHITADHDLRSAAATNGKTPKLGIVIDVRTVRLRTEPALEAAQAWDTDHHLTAADVPTIGALVADPDGTSTTKTRLLTAVTDRATGFDYRRNLY